MKFSYQWVKELAPGVDVEAAALGQLITMKTAECEGVVPFGESLDSVCLAKVISAEPIPGSSHNQKVVVDTGRYGVKTVVCGASNCSAGVVTAYVPVGATVAGRQIGVAAIEGVVSEGMLASGADLGLSRDHSGILVFEEGEAGASLPGVGADSIIEIDNKSLTHRPDLWGHYGMAREVSAITGLALRDPVDLGLLPEGAGAVRVAVEDAGLCPRYSALVVENVTVGPSPLWLQARLTAVGLNPISNIVDVTNFVMAELSQPMHAFDADKLAGDTITVRPAREGERMAALNGETYELSPSNLVIADEAGAIALAGVIGGQDSAISAGTTRIVFESATFQASSVRKTSSKLRLRTDASMRFEKAQDPANTLRGLARAVDLLRQVSPGIRVVGGVTDVYSPLPAPAPIEISVGWLSAKLGTAVPLAEVRRILEALQFRVKATDGDRLLVTVPSWRATKDVTIKDDLVEEVGRMIGYDNIAPVAPLVPARVPVQLPFRSFLRRVRQTVADQGFTEVFNYSFVNEEMIARFGLPADAHVGVANPIASDQSMLRTSLLPRIWTNIVENSKHSEEFRLFEIGREIHPRAEGLPEEKPRLVAVVFRKDDGAAGLFELKRLAECLVPGAEAKPVAARAYEHPSRAAEMLVGGHSLGRLFELHPRLMEVGRAAVLELDLPAVEAYAPVTEYRPIRRTPASSFDLSIVVGQRVLVGDLRTQLTALAGPLLEAVQFVSVYSGHPVPEGQKSVSFRLRVASRERTLASEEVGEIRTRVIEGMRAAGYQLMV